MRGVRLVAHGGDDATAPRSRSALQYPRRRAYRSRWKAASPRVIAATFASPSRAHHPWCRATPAEVPRLRGVEQLVAGGATTCARLRDGTVRCWGEGFDTAVPVRVAGLAHATLIAAGVAQVASGLGHSCALSREGTLWCWGDNASSRLPGQISPPDAGAPVRTQVSRRPRERAHAGLLYAQHA